MRDDVFPVMAKRWYGYGPDDYYWALFSIHGDEESAEKSIKTMENPSARGRRRRDMLNPYAVGRAPEFMYQRNMVL